MVLRNLHILHLSYHTLGDRDSTHKMYKYIMYWMLWIILKQLTTLNNKLLQCNSYSIIVIMSILFISLFIVPNVSIFTHNIWSIVKYTLLILMKMKCIGWLIRCLRKCLLTVQKQTGDLGSESSSKMIKSMWHRPKMALLKLLWCILVAFLLEGIPWCCSFFLENQPLKKKINFFLSKSFGESPMEMQPN